MCLAIDSTVCFLAKTGPCKPTVTRPQAGVELPPFWIEQNALTVSVFAGLKKLSLQIDGRRVPGHQQRRWNRFPEKRERVGRSGTQLMRYRDGSKMDSVMIDRCVERGPERRCQQSPEQPGICLSHSLMRKVGRPYHFSAVAASSEATLRTPNAAVTKNSADIGRGFWLPTAWSERASAHVTTTLRLPVTRAASERGKVGASFHSSWHSLAISISPACGVTGGRCCGPQGLSRLAAPIGVARNINRCRTVPASVLGTNRRTSGTHRCSSTRSTCRLAPTLRRVFCRPRRIGDRFVGHSAL
jgi:hypothetical protein